jgi:hypothetical protein
MIVSVPTSRRPIDLGSMLYFSRRFETTGWGVSDGVGDENEDGD